MPCLIQWNLCIAATGKAFALWCSGGDKIVTWGDPHNGGDNSAVEGQLRSVQHVQATWDAFAAILEGGLVVTWGDLEGGDSSAVHDQLRKVQQILADGSIATWGNPDCGGDCQAVLHQIKHL